MKVVSALIFLLTSNILPAKLIQPGELFDYPAKAFYPDRWKKLGLDQPMIPWEGEQITFVTHQGQKLDPKVMTEFIHHLDDAWELYHELTGYTPRLNKHYRQKSSIVALPENSLSCGYGCGYVGSTGIEMIRFYDDHYQLLKKDAKNIPHAYFYEMGRNYYGFGDRHNAFTTGFAVFMRYVCIDSLGFKDRDVRTGKVIREAIDLWEKSEMPFVAGFTAHGGKGEKGARLFDSKGKPIRPSDQNVLYASLLLKLRAEFGGNDFVKRFYQQINDAPRGRAVGPDSAHRQCLSLLVAASIAARTDLSPRFVDQYRLKLSQETRALLSKTLWDKKGLMVSQVFAELDQLESAQ